MRTVALCAVAGLLAGLAISLTFPDEYVSQSFIGTNPDAARAVPDPAAEFDRRAGAALSNASLVPIVERLNLYSAERSDAIHRAGRMRASVEITRATFRGYAAHRVAFRYPDRYGAMNGLQDIVQRATSPLYPVLDLPNLPETPSVRPRVLASAEGLAGGLLVGALVALLRRKYEILRLT